MKIESRKGYAIAAFRRFEVARLEFKKKEAWPYSYEGRTALYLFPQVGSLSSGTVAYGGWLLSVHKEEEELYPSIVVTEGYLETASALDAVHPFYALVGINAKRVLQLRFDPGIKL